MQFGLSVYTRVFSHILPSPVTREDNPLIMNNKKVMVVKYAIPMLPSHPHHLKIIYFHYTICMMHSFDCYLKMCLMYKK